MTTSGNDIVVVEDEEEARTFLTAILQFEGFNAVGFGDGKEALDYLLTNPSEPCLIVLDIRMPAMDGVQFRSLLSREQRLAKIPVVVVTALDPSAAAGMSALKVFRKPLDIDALIEVVRQNC